MSFAEYSQEAEVVSACLGFRVQHLGSSSLGGESDNTWPTRHSKLGLQIMEMTSEKILTKHYL